MHGLNFFPSAVLQHETKWLGSGRGATTFDICFSLAFCSHTFTDTVAVPTALKSLASSTIKNPCGLSPALALLLLFPLLPEWHPSSSFIYLNTSVGESWIWTHILVPLIHWSTPQAFSALTPLKKGKKKSGDCWRECSFRKERSAG